MSSHPYTPAQISWAEKNIRFRQSLGTYYSSVNFQEEVAKLLAETYPGQVAVEYPAPVPAVQHQYNQTQVRQARDKAVYTREQRGHSLTLHLLLGFMVLWIPAIYITASPNHYWHA